MDCGIELSAAISAWCPSPWRLQHGPTSSSFYGDAVHRHRWVCIGLRPMGLFPSPIPSFPDPAPSHCSYRRHVDPALNLVDSGCLPLPAIVTHMDTTTNLPATAPHQIALLQPPISVHTAHSVFVLDPDFPAIEPHPTANSDISRFSATFGVPFTSSLGVNHLCALSLPELLACYYIP
jgi:hypothetical protein